MRVSDPSFVQLWDDAFLYMIKPVEPLKSAASFITRKKYILMHENINDACKLYIDHKLYYKAIQVYTQCSLSTIISLLSHFFITSYFL